MGFIWDLAKDSCKSFKARKVVEPPVFRQTLWVAAAALATELPIATKSAWGYGEIDRHVPLPGIYNPVEMVWHTRKAPPRNRIRSRRMTDVGIATPVIPSSS